MAELKDSGARQQFKYGAVRDVSDDKGRTDLMPIDVIASLMPERLQSEILTEIHNFMMYKQDHHLFRAIHAFVQWKGWDIYTALLEVSKHYQDGCNKYGERNWEKGIDLHCYIDSGVRHFLKCCRGDNDEPHDRAFIWNMLGAIWTFKYHSLDDINLRMSEAPNDLVKSAEELSRCTKMVGNDGSIDAKVKSFADYSFTEIKKIAEAGHASSMFSIGDSRIVTDANGKDWTIQIIGFNHDDKADGSGKSNITFRVFPTNLDVYSKMFNTWDTSIKPGYLNSDSLGDDIRKYSSDVFEAIGCEGVDVIKTVYNSATFHRCEGFITKSFALSSTEIAGVSSNLYHYIHAQPIGAEGEQYQYFKDNGLSKEDVDSKWGYWTRSFSAEFASCGDFAVVGRGYVGYRNYNCEGGVVFGFCF